VINFQNFYCLKILKNIFNKPKFNLVQLVLNTSVTPFKNVFRKFGILFLKIYWNFEIFKNIFLKITHYMVLKH